MSGDVMKFIMLVETFFPRPKFAGDEKREALWMRSMREILGGMDDETLARAAKIIIETRDPDKDGTTFPKPKECVAACARAQEVIAAERPKPLLAAPDANDWSDERLSLAFDLCKSELGKRAAREGWVASLYDFCRRTMRLPGASEIAKLISDARGFDEDMAKFRGLPQTSLVRALVSGFEWFSEERKRLAERILKEVA